MEAREQGLETYCTPYRGFSVGSEGRNYAGVCPAGQCKALIRYEVTDDCIGCTRCAQQCPADAIAPTPYEKHAIDPVRCVRCDGCRVVCPVGAIVVKSGRGL